MMLRKTTSRSTSDNLCMRQESHPRQSFAITALVCITASVAIYFHLVWTAATLTGLGVSVAFALLVGWLRAGTWPAALTGSCLLTAMYLATVTQPHGSCWASALSPLILLLMLTLLATRFRRAVKEQSGLAEDRRGRSASQVCANLGVAAMAADFRAIPAFHHLALLGLSAAFAEATADTLSSEFGQAMPGSRTVLLTTGQLVTPGTDGGISLLGTLTGSMGGLLVATACAWALRLDWKEMLLVWLCGVAGIFFDSWLGATLERRGWLGNNAVNFCSTLFSALLATVLAAVWARP